MSSMREIAMPLRMLPARRGSDGGNRLWSRVSSVRTVSVSPPRYEWTMDWGPKLRALARQQHGVVSRAQGRQAGADYEAVRVGIRRGEWQTVSPRVLRLIGAPWTDHSALMAAVLDAGETAVASHRS